MIVRADEGALLNAGSKRFVTGVSAFFATMYFIQGVGDPTSGLIAQPARALLKQWGEGPASIGAFMALVSLPWMLKPLFGLLSDFVPLLGSHRRSYLLFSSVSASLGLLALYVVPLPEGARWVLFFCLLVPTIGIAFGDVLVDALMVEVGQPRGLTGRLQSIQWTAVYVAMLLSGVLGGYVVTVDRHDIAFLVCGLLWAVSFALALRYARDAPRSPVDEGLGATATGLKEALRRPGLITVALFLFVWSFNPSWVSVQYLHVTETLGFGEQAYGNASSLFSAGCVVASIGYGFYCRRVALGRLVNLAIIAGILGYGVYLHMERVETLYQVSFIAGVANMTGNLIQLDVAARLVPVRVAATCFAILMAVSNLAASSSEALGSWAYEWLGSRLGAMGAYQVVVVASALFAAACWLLVPRLRREVPEWWR